MKTLIFNDTHLTDAFDQEWFNYIAKLLDGVDQIVINGDFWDGYLTTWDEFFNSNWTKLLELLASKDCIYVFGNHDKENFMDERIYKFAKVATHNHELSFGKKLFKISHGDKIAPTYDNTFLFRNPDKTRPKYQLFERLVHGNKLINKIYQPLNEMKNLKQMVALKNHASKNYNKNEYHVFGHSHISEFNPDCGFINVGAFQNGSPSYLIIENDKIEFVAGNNKFWL
jgi:predicted phosphodiesterase